MKKVLNLIAYTIVFLVLGWMARCMMKTPSSPQDPNKPLINQLKRNTAQEKVIKFCGSLNNVIVRGDKVFCQNGLLVDGVQAQDLKR